VLIHDITRKGVRRRVRPNHGYQPAQKWLKDRSGRTLSYEDLNHYQRIIKALAMTNEIMNLIDE